MQEQDFSAYLERSIREYADDHFLVEEPYRGQGYGRQTLAALDEVLTGMGAESVGLHVFAHNRTAIGLYEKMGYETTDLHMRKVYSGK